MTSLKTSIKTITYLSDIGCLEIQGASLITHTFDFQHVADAISLFEQDQKHCCKVLLTFFE